MKKQIFKKLKLPQGSAILDLGCYDGSKNKWMRRKKYIYQGIDLLFEDSYVKKANFVPWLKKNKKKYNLILSEFSLQQIPRIHLWETVKNIQKILKPGGYFFLTSFNEADAHGPFFTEKEYLKIGRNLSILFKNHTTGIDKKKRKRSVTEILYMKRPE